MNAQDGTAKWIVSHQTIGDERYFLFQTEHGLLWEALSEAKARTKPLQPALFSLEEAQRMADQYGSRLDVTPSKLGIEGATEMVVPGMEAGESVNPPQEKQRPGIARRVRGGVQRAVSGAAVRGTAGSLNPPKKEETKGKRKFSILMFFLCFALGITLFLILVWNVQPFIKFVEILAGKLNFGRFAEMLLAIPLLGGMFAAIAQFIFAVVGTVIYAICQLIEIAPMLYRRDPERMKRLIEAWQGWAKYQINRSDPSALKQLKTDYNNNPIVSYRWLTTACHVVYLFELVVCFIAEPPCKPAWNFPWYLMTFQFGKIDWMNVLLMISVLFAAQWVVAGILKICPEVWHKVKEGKA